MATILKLKIRLNQLMHVYIKYISAKFHPNLISNDRSLGFFWSRSSQQQEEQEKEQQDEQRYEISFDPINKQIQLIPLTRQIAWRR